MIIHFFRCGFLFGKKDCSLSVFYFLFASSARLLLQFFFSYAHQYVLCFAISHNTFPQLSADNACFNRVSPSFRSTTIIGIFERLCHHNNQQKFSTACTFYVHWTFQTFFIPLEVETVLSITQTTRYCFKSLTFFLPQSFSTLEYKRNVFIRWILFLLALL